LASIGIDFDDGDGKKLFMRSFCSRFDADDGGGGRGRGGGGGGCSGCCCVCGSTVSALEAVTTC